MEIENLRNEISRLKAIVYEQKRDIKEYKQKHNQQIDLNHQLKRRLLKEREDHLVVKKKLEQIHRRRINVLKNKSSPDVKRKNKKTKRRKTKHSSPSQVIKSRRLEEFKERVNSVIYTFKFPKVKTEFYDRFREYEQVLKKKNQKDTLGYRKEEEEKKDTDYLLMKQMNDYFSYFFILQKIEFILERSAYQRIVKLIKNYTPRKHKENVGKVLQVMISIVSCCYDLEMFKRGFELCSRFSKIVADIRNRDIVSFDRGITKIYGLERTSITHIYIEKERFQEAMEREKQKRRPRVNSKGKKEKKGVVVEKVLEFRDPPNSKLVVRRMEDEKVEEEEEEVKENLVEEVEGEEEVEKSTQEEDEEKKEED